MHSALQRGGLRLHALAREGIEVERAPRPIRVDELTVLAIEPPRIRLAIACGKGTYVRALVRDLGQRLACGAMIAELRRTASGRFTVDGAIPLPFLDRPTAIARLVSPADALGCPAVTVPAADERDVLDGRMRAIERFLPPDLAVGERFQLLTEAGAVLAVVLRHAERLELARVLTYGAATPPVAGKLGPRTAPR